MTVIIHTMSFQWPLSFMLWEAHGKERKLQLQSRRGALKSIVLSPFSWYIRAFQLKDVSVENYSEMLLSLFQQVLILCASPGRESVYKRTLAYSKRGRVENLDFLAYVIRIWPLIQYEKQISKFYAVQLERFTDFNENAKAKRKSEK